MSTQRNVIPSDGSEDHIDIPTIEEAETSDGDFFSDDGEQDDTATIQYVVDAESDEQDDDDDDDDDDYEDTEGDTASEMDAGQEDESILSISAGQLRQLESMLQSEGSPEQLRAVLQSYGFTLTENGIVFEPNRPRRERPKYAWPPIPSPEGRMLMQSGNFGYHCDPHGGAKAKRDVHSQLLTRELGLESPKLQRTKLHTVAQTMTPSSSPDVVINFDKRGYSGQFSDDGNFFFTCNQDSKIRMYDTSNPYQWKYYKAMSQPTVAWTITDASLSPDNRWLASCSLEPVVYLHSTEKSGARHARRLDLWRSASDRYRDFGIFSVRFGNDGRELVAGTNAHEIRVFDIEADKTVLRIGAHANDVNAVCYGEKGSPHILYSGSDDTTVKVWDRRSLGNNRPAGVFLGHTEGVTYIDSKGDGRYIVSNSKDQTMKLWDIRKSVAPDEVTMSDMQGKSHFDYRWEYYNERHRVTPERDCSLVTFRGHKVLYTLIRCHFSPQGSSDGRYVYSGSADGKVYIWNLDGSIASTITVGKGPGDTSVQHQTKVRDASWHPSAPIIAATSWNGGGGHNGTCTVHSWNDTVDTDEEARPRAHLTEKLDRMQRRRPATNNEFNDW